MNCSQREAELVAAEYRYPAGSLITKEDLEYSKTDTCIYVASRQLMWNQDIHLVME